MPNKVLHTPTFEIEVNTKPLDRMARKVLKATRNALRKVGLDYAKKIHEGFKREGINPINARGGHWPKLKIPSGPTKKGGRTKRGKILKKSGDYLKATSPRNASITVRGSGGKMVMKIAYKKLPSYAKYHEQVGNSKGYTQTVATARQAAFLRFLGFRGVSKGSIITLPARRVFVYPPSWRGVHKRLFLREIKKSLGV